MDLLLDEERRLLRDSAERLSRALGGTPRARRTDARADPETWAALSRAGWLSLFSSAVTETSQLGVFDLALILRETSRHWLIAPLAGVLAASRALVLANSQTHAAIIAEIGAGRICLMPALQGSGTAYNPDGPFPALVKTASGIRLSGAHRYLDEIVGTDWLLVAATENDTPVLLLMRADGPGITIETHRTFDRGATSTLTFADATLDDDAIVATGAAAERLIQETRHILAIATAVELLGVGESALVLTLDQLKTRQQFGRPIGSFQVLQHRAADSFVALELLTSLAFRVAGAFDSGFYHRAMIPALKAKAGSSVLALMREALQIHGAMGFTQEHDIGLHYKRALALSARYGNEMNQLSRFAELTGLTS